MNYCECGELLPSRARVRVVLEGGLEHLNLAKLCDAVHGKPLPATTAQRLAMLGHALLRAVSMLERCERCLDAELERAALNIAQRLQR